MPSIPEDKMIKALKNNKSIRQALLEVGIAAKGANYKRCNQLIEKYNIKMK
jgi:hypothetical protein